MVKKVSAIARELADRETIRACLYVFMAAWIESRWSVCSRLSEAAGYGNKRPLNLGQRKRDDRSLRVACPIVEVEA